MDWWFLPWRLRQLRVIKTILGGLGMELVKGSYDSVLNGDFVEGSESSWKVFANVWRKAKTKDENGWNDEIKQVDDRWLKN